MSHLVAAMASLLGFVLLALAMARHQLDLFGREFAAWCTRALRIGGWVALLGALIIASSAQGWSLGLVAWCGHISVTAGVVILTLVALDRRKQARFRR